jgi:hypothetical protein
VRPGLDCRTGLKFIFENIRLIMTETRRYSISHVLILVLVTNYHVRQQNAGEIILIGK